ncbi:hypothetical protein [uncultured Methanobrevibacter sp.]|uniref:hypothetical protein n=1 Tax=uncultured Methanobrevibacter sp. TaxID=253161 RepID=UPI002624D19E|nr:hypothetical protein [uncultured Methanobrevibacter sp.]
MARHQVSLMINSTFYDMFAEYLLFIKEIYPELQKICQKHDIDLIYRDVAFSVPKESFNRGIILQDLRYIDEDRTFFICFRAQKLGWRPCPVDVGRMVLNEYPETVDYICNVSITELAIMHALRPFAKCVDGEITQLPPVKHSLFYFRKPDYLEGLSDEQKKEYVNLSNGKDKEVLDLEIAKAKDLIFDTKEEFEDNDECDCYIDIREYDSKWSDDLNQKDMMMEYVREYEKINGVSLDYFVGIHKEYVCEKSHGGLCDLTYENTDLKEVIIEDILNALKIEFPENFA